MRRLAFIAVEVFVPIAVMVAWWSLSANSLNPFWPPLADIWASFREDWTGSRLTEDVAPSLIRMGSAFAIASTLGVAIGVALGLSTRMRQYFDPALQFLRAVPPPALIPVALLLFGLGDSGKVFLIVLGAVWPVVLSTEDGIRSAEPLLDDVARVYRISGMRRLRTVLLPAAGPQVFAGLRTCLSICLLLMVVSEMVAATDGLGHFIMQSQRTLQMTSMWSGMFLLGVLGYVLTGGFLLCQRRVLRWHPDFRGGHRD